MLVPRREVEGEAAVTAQLSPLERSDWLWAAGTGLLAAVIFATALTGHPGLTDGSEAPAGVASLGILHAPGYPAYVLAAKAFSLLVPVGGDAFRVNLFSLVCGALSIAGVQLLARRAGASRPAAALGALALAASAGFWFYAVFSKHDVFSGLTFLASLHLVLAWMERPTWRRAAALGGVYALGLGASWPLMVMLLPAIGFAVVVQRRELTFRVVGAALACGAAVLFVSYGYVVVRAGQNPAVNWGDATDLSRLIALVKRQDFTTGSAIPAVAPAQPGGGGGLPAAVLTLPIAASHLQLSFLLTYLAMFWRELGPAASLLAIWGLGVSLVQRRGPVTWVLLLAFGTDLIGTLSQVGFENHRGYGGDLIQEGFLLGCYFVLACWIALGAADLLARARAQLSARRAGSHQVSLGALGAVVAALVLVPSVAAHWRPAHASSRPLADGYATAVFSELPPHAALFVGGDDLNLPLTYRQIVLRDRPDVAVVAVGGLRFGWYRKQASHSLGQPLPPFLGGTLSDLARVIAIVKTRRTVYLDPQAAEYVRGTINAQPIGVLERVAEKGAPAAAPAAVEQNLRRAERQAYLTDSAWNLWPNTYLRTATFSTAALRVARLYYQDHNIAGMRRALQNVLTFDPGNASAQQDLQALAASGQ